MSATPAWQPPSGWRRHVIRARRARSGMSRARASDYARFTLAGVRLFNGVTGLLVPGKVAARLGADPEASPGLAYMQRMFGIRTILIAAELVIPDRRLRSW